MNYQSYGDSNKTALVFLHGFLGSSSQFEFLIDALSKDYYLVLVDLPGCGEDASDLNDDISFESFVSKLSSFLEELNLRQAVLVGYSLGARLGLYVHLKLGFKFQAMFLESLNPGLADSKEKTLRAEKDQQLSDQILNGNYQQFLSSWYSAELFADLAKEDLVASALKCNASNQAMILKNLSPGRMPSMWDDLAKINIPVYLLTGELDSKFTRLSDEALKLMPNASHEIIAEAGHNIHLSKPEKYLNVLKEFLT